MENHIISKGEKGRIFKETEPEKILFFVFQVSLMKKKFQKVEEHLKWI